MRVLVTGANGFIGQHVCKALFEKGHDAIGLDVNSFEPMREFLGTKNFISADITRALRAVAGLDAVIHLAAVANPRACDANPTLAFDVNVNGTNQVLKMALESGAKKFIFSSSAHVYDIPPKYLPTDEMHPLRLNNTYTTTKILGEELCELYWENHGLNYTVLRLYNAYGPGQGKGYFIPDQIAKAKAGTIVLQGSNVTKDWVYVGDVARAFVAALDTNFVGPVNIGTGIETDLNAVAKVIGKGMGVMVEAVSDPRATRMQANRGRAERVLGWKPTVDIWEGLRACLDSTEVRPIPA